jgi:hypothetical protein
MFFIFPPSEFVDPIVKILNFFAASKAFNIWRIPACCIAIKISTFCAKASSWQLRMQS